MGPGEVFELDQSGTLINHLEVHSQHLGRNPGMAVDSAGYIYTNEEGFSQFQILRYDSAGNFLGFVTPSSELTTMTVDPETGVLYTDRAGGGINFYEFNGAGEVIEAGGKSCHLSPEFEHGCHPSGFFATRLKGIEGLAVDPVTHELYVDLGDEIVQVTPTGESIGAPIGIGELHHSLGIAVSASHEVYATNGVGVQIASYGPSELSPDPTSTTRSSSTASAPPDTQHGGFPAQPDGSFAAFPSSLPLTGYDSGAITRSIAMTARTNPRLRLLQPDSEQGTADASLPVNGLGLSDDGRVFFNAGEGLVDRDLNEKEDAYEWEPEGFEGVGADRNATRPAAASNLISGGVGSFGSSLLGVSSHGVDAYFFTRDKLVEQDENGNTMKIYDAREAGGFPYVPPLTQCKASDECHGPGTGARRRRRSTPSQASRWVTRRRCTASEAVKKQGRCVRKRKHSVTRGRGQHRWFRARFR